VVSKLERKHWTEVLGWEESAKGSTDSIQYDELFVL
jgi:hypothetical protein